VELLEELQRKMLCRLLSSVRLRRLGPVQGPGDGAAGVEWVEVLP
jgi:hypothetical protein